MVELHEGEKIVLIVRRHWFFILRQIFVAILAAFLPSIFFSLVFKPMGVEFHAGVNLFFFSFWLFLVWSGIFLVLTNDYLDTWIITNFRIIDIEQQTLFKREISEYRIENIQDVTVNVSGIFPTFLKFGKIDVQTAGEKDSLFIMNYVISPFQVKQTIMQLKHNLLKLEWEQANGPSAKTGI